LQLAGGGDLFEDFFEDGSRAMGVAIVEVGFGDDAVGAGGDEEVFHIVGGDVVAAFEQGIGLAGVSNS